jgi:hypothetical protein
VAGAFLFIVADFGAIAFLVRQHCGSDEKHLKLGVEFAPKPIQTLVMSAVILHSENDPPPTALREIHNQVPPHSRC